MSVSHRDFLRRYDSLRAARIAMFKLAGNSPELAQAKARKYQLALRIVSDLEREMSEGLDKAKEIMLS